MMSQKPTIIFVCEHGAAKSIIAAAYFNQLASASNLNLHAIARGTQPDVEFSTKTIEGLHNDGLTLPLAIPQKLTLLEMESAEKVVSFCELPQEYLTRGIYEHWRDVPPVSEDYEKARDVIIAKLQAMMKQLT